MALVALSDVDFGFGNPPLFQKACLRIEEGDRIALIGRNGAGKSTLLKLIEKSIDPHDGEVLHAAGLRVARLIQEVPSGKGESIFEVVAGGLDEDGRRLAEYQRLTRELAAVPSDDATRKLDRLQTELDAEGGWQIEGKIDRILQRMKLDPTLTFSALSSGMKRRVLLARTLVSEPNLLMLDEPTNHLDIAAICWLEEFLAGYRGTLLFVTHDRAFLQRLATRIVEIDRGQLRHWECDYQTFLERREEALAAEEKQQALFDKKLAEEEAWIRQGIKARRTRNEGRVRALKKLREERRQRRERTGQVKLNVQDADRSGKMVVKAQGICQRFGDHTVIDDFATQIFRGDRIGIVGPNGSGKTTLLRILLGKLEPTAGEVRFGTDLKIAYFDQLRDQLDDEMSVKDAVAEGSDFVMLDGNKRHVIGYLRDFLFSPEMANMHVRRLSGGERNRLLLARLFARPSNLLVLDEPTNDLDTETLELLEEVLLEYPGTVLLVSHDRQFLNNVVTASYVFEADGHIHEFDGGYQDWQDRIAASPVPADAARKDGAASNSSSKDVAVSPAPPPPVAEKPKAKKLSFKEQRELEELPGRIERLEGEQQTWSTKMADPAFYRQPADEIASSRAEMERVEAELAEAYERWEALEGRA